MYQYLIQSWYYDNLNGVFELEVRIDFVSNYEVKLPFGKNPFNTFY